MSDQGVTVPNVVVQEIGKLHMQNAMLQDEVNRLSAEVARLTELVPKVDEGQ